MLHSKITEKSSRSEKLKLASLSSLGINLLLCTLIGMKIGTFLDQFLKTGSVFTIAMIILGSASGYVAIFRQLGK